MSSSLFYSVVIDAADPCGLADFWAAVLGYPIVFESEDGTEVAVAKDRDTPPALLFIKNDDPKTGKNRLHFDLNPTDQQAEVDRIIGLGAKPVDIGQSDVTWVVLADPEGNEFCVLTAR